MSRKMLFILFLFLFPLCGADCEQKNYTGSVTVNKTDGVVTSVKVVFSSVGQCTVQNRKEAAALIAEWESILTDLKAAADQFPVDEQGK